MRKKLGFRPQSGASVRDAWKWMSQHHVVVMKCGDVGEGRGRQLDASLVTAHCFWVN